MCLLMSIKCFTTSTEKYNKELVCGVIISEMYISMMQNEFVKAQLTN